MEAKIYNIEGKEAGTIALSEKVFGLPWNADLVHQVVVSMQSNKRSNTAHTKDRGEVRGGGRKPWQQKGTGRARHGSRRSPIWKGGGMTHGPRNERNYEKKINKKMSAKALATLLSEKFRTGHVIFVDELSLKASKTKEAAKVISSLASVRGFEKLSYKRAGTALLALPKKEVATERSFRNLPNAMVGEVRNLNPLDLIGNRYLLIVNPKESVAMIEKRLS